MPLPDLLRVKLSSEAAEGISVTPVVVRDMPLRELVEQMLGITGKDEARIGELLRRGTLVSGASRFRWSGWDPDRAALRELLATFPDPEPQRPFAPERAMRVILRGGRQPIEIPRQAGERKPLFRRRSFWTSLLEAVGGAPTHYQTYSYRERADIYHLELDPAAVERVRAASGLLTYTLLRDRVRQEPFASLDIFTER